MRTCIAFLRARLPVVNATSLAGVAILALATGGAHAAAPCNELETVGGGALGISPGSVGPPDSLGWDVGSGQCNGSFTVTRDFAFPSAGGNGIELGLRAEERREGQVANVGGSYEVETGHDTTPPEALNLAWWSFQQSIAYDGEIDDLDELLFVIRTDDGPSVPAGPTDMLDPVLRAAIESRNNRPNPTSTYAELYQTSQNPVFGWFDSYDVDDEGAWTLTLAAAKDGALADVSICIHTPEAACAPPPLVYSCAGNAPGAFMPPANATINVPNPRRTVPLHMRCRDADGRVLTPADIAPPVLVASKVPSGAATTDGLLRSRGHGGPGGAFTFTGGMWRFNLDLSNFTAPGAFEIRAAAGGDDLLLGAPTLTLVIN
jgi:hypothetical protein